MQLDLQARGFTLTSALADTVQWEAAALSALLGGRTMWVQVRLFDVNGAKGGLDKGCLVLTRVGRRRRVCVASSIDEDLYRAIPSAFGKLRRAVLAASDREHTLRRRERTSDVGAHVS